MAKVEWHPGELYPRVDFVITNLTQSVERVGAFYNQRGTAEQWIKDGKGARSTRLSCRTFAANAVRRQLDALAYDMGNFMPTLGDARDVTTLVTDQPAREANDQDRRQGRQPWAPRDLPDGRDRGAATDVRRHPVADQRVAVSTSPSIKGAGATFASNEEEVCVDTSRSARFPLRCRQRPASIALCSRRRQFAIAEDVQRRDVSSETGSIR